MNNNYRNDDFQIHDYGPEPEIFNLNCLGNQNHFFRTALWTGKHFQITLMEINPCDDIGLEMHEHTDQLLQIISGTCSVSIGSDPHHMNFKKKAGAGCAIIIPAGTYHNLVNTGNGPLKLYSVYAPPEHLFGTVERCK